MSPPESRRVRQWTAAALAVSLPVVVLLCMTLWRAPYPISESIGHFEDVERRPVTSFLVPSTSYYRPLFYVALVTTVFVFWTHRANIQRLRAGTEYRFSRAANFGRRPSLAIGLGLLILAAAFLAARAGHSAGGAG